MLNTQMARTAATKTAKSTFMSLDDGCIPIFLLPLQNIIGAKV
jgi:hypothetical protein